MERSVSWTKLSVDKIKPRSSTLQRVQACSLHGSSAHHRHFRKSTSRSWQSLTLLDELSEEDKLTVDRARKVQRSLSQTQKC